MTDELNTEQPPLTPGPLLRDAREQMGLSSQQIAQRLNLRHSVVQGIEQDHYEPDMSITYIRGYIRNYARLVGLNEQQLNSALEGMYQPQPTQDMHSFSERTKRERSDSRWRLLTWAMVLGLLLALAWWFYNSQSEAPQALQLPTPASLAQPAAPAPVRAATTNNAISPLGSLASDGDATEQPTDTVVEDRDANADDTTTAGNAAGSDDNVEPDSTKVTALSDAADEVAILPALTVTLSADCWMLVQDADGNKLIEGLKQAGFSQSVVGTAPYKLRLGAPEAVSLSFDGKAIDLSSFSAGKVARLTVPR
ncbi:RodZ domain-containing protein [uncultured Ferrimonas sp.]|uniref:RodZ domain-containing protein n=1 Tax=uncultured Ferrimonas sp. TaxID=432640 RepID=UPI002623CCA8|nr:RodZ domain-containing protein [uncultured Ferrimonas sp.]